MSSYIPAIFSLTVLAAGWYYIFYSQAASKLKGVEDSRLNQRRILLRRINGITMMLLAVAFYACCYTIDPRTSVGGLVIVSIPVLMVIMLVLAMIDLKMTRAYWRSRRDRR